MALRPRGALVCDVASNTAGVIRDRAQRVHMHIKAAGAVAPCVPVRSKADHFERDGAEQRQNTWQNRDLRPILPLEPTGLDGTHPQPPAFPVDLHGSALGAGSRPCMCLQQGRAGWEMGSPPQNMHFSLLSDPPKTLLERFLA